MCVGECGGAVSADALLACFSFHSSRVRPVGMAFQVDEREGDLIVTSGDFCAIYFKPNDQPQLILRRRTQTDDHELLAQAWQAANDKARELGWIV